jgi:hypothetical protein
LGDLLLPDQFAKRLGPVAAGNHHVFAGRVLVENTLPRSTVVGEMLAGCRRIVQARTVVAVARHGC